MRVGHDNSGTGTVTRVLTQDTGTQVLDKSDKLMQAIHDNTGTGTVTLLQCYTGTDTGTGTG